MRRGRDTDEIRAPEDILLRASRPQRHSSFLPTHRDWRYQTGVYQHEDFEETQKDMSVWDELDYDASIGVFGRERRRDRRRAMTRTSTFGSASGEEEWGGSTGESVETGGTAEVETPKKVVIPKTPRASKKMSEMMGRPHNRPEADPATRPSRATVVTKFKRTEDAVDGEDQWEKTNVLVRLNFTGDNIRAVQRILKNLPPTPPQTPGEFKIPKTPATARTATSFHSQHIWESIESAHTFPLFERLWVDETQAFNMKKVVASLRTPDKEAEALPVGFNWFPDAVPVDAIFPPGVPMSAKEINAWFRGLAAGDLPITPGQMNMFLRDALRRKLPDFKATDGLWKGKPDRNLFTDDARPGKYIKDRRHGFIVPTFDDLLKGLKYLPTGLDARGLTQCLVWYLNFRDKFSPRLELNVLHTQSLIRALRQPLKAFGPQNLDMNALKEWKEKGTFAERRVEDEERRYENTVRDAKEIRKSQLELIPGDESIKLHLKLHTRHVLMLPFVAMLGMTGKALEMGVEKAEERKAEKLANEKKPEEEDAEANDKTTNETGEGEQQDKLRPYRIPKRPRVEENAPSERPSKMSVRKRSQVPTALRLLSASPAPVSSRRPSSAAFSYPGDGPSNA